MELDVTDCTMGNTFTMAVTDLLSSLNLEVPMIWMNFRVLWMNWMMQQ